MSLISIRLPDELDARLNREAASTHRAKSDITRAAIVEYLDRQERDRYLTAFARGARARREDLVALAAEALPLDNEALALAEKRLPREPKPIYRRKAGRAR